jgi:hypothetical protein
LSIIAPPFTKLDGLHPRYKSPLPNKSNQDPDQRTENIPYSSRYHQVHKATEEPVALLEPNLPFFIEQELVHKIQLNWKPKNHHFTSLY